MNCKEHWNHVYQTKAPDDVSWFQTRPAISLKLIEAAGVAKTAGVIDIGVGASVLVDFLLDAGFKPLAVLDISAAALGHAKQRLGERAGEITWFEADVTEFNAPPGDVSGLMFELLAWWNKDAAKMSPVLSSAIVHYRFESIHPFADGNERTGRAGTMGTLPARLRHAPHFFRGRILLGKPPALLCGFGHRAARGRGFDCLARIRCRRLGSHP